MAKTTKPKEIDITKTGPVGYRQLQQANSLDGSNDIKSLFDGLGINSTPISLYDPVSQSQQDVVSPLIQQETFSGSQDYLGRSQFDSPVVTEEQFQRLGDVRAENQPWYSKLLNGIGKAGVLATTTALETAGLLYGIGQGIYNETEGGSFLQGLWDNPITNALKNINDASEELMPNYYTQDEQENPWGNIFTANFLGDKLIKNLGFMVGAFYGGMPASSLIGKVGTAAVKSARTAVAARAGGMARRFAELTSGYGDDVLGKVGQYGREIAGLSDDAAASIGGKYGEDVTSLYRKLAQEGLTEGEKGKKFLEGLEKINSIANTTRAITQTIGVVGSAINEGAIEALNNSEDWARKRTKEVEDKYQQAIADIEQKYGDTPEGMDQKILANAAYREELAAIQKGKAEVGNADLLMNLPILLASNAYQLGRLYTRGFNSTRREMGSFWNSHKLSGSLEKGTLATDKKTWKGVLSALSKSNTEGMEELTQGMAADAAGNAVDNAIARYMSAGNSEEAKTNVDDYIAGMGKAISDNLQDPEAWEEYMIGAVSSMVGMPVFGSQTKNAYLGKGRAIGLQGGFFGELGEYREAMQHEHNIAEYLNGRIKDPKFKALYDNLRKQDDYDRWLQEQIELGDKSEYKDLELEKFYQDINAAASSGYLEEFKQLVGYNQDYTDDELADIVKQTSKKITAEQQKQQDENRKSYLEGAIQTAISNNEDALVKDYTEELDEVNKRLEKADYQDKLEGPFIDRNGQMNVTDPDKMREVLERNRQNLLQGIDDYLKIRNDIDIETDGRLDDDQIATLTMMRGKILDYDRRSADMTDDIVTTLTPLQVFVDKIKNATDKSLEVAREKLKEAKQELNAADGSQKTAKEKAVLIAEKRVNDAELASRINNNLSRLFEMLTEEKEATRSEQKALNRGYGRDSNGDTYIDNYGDKRTINSEEAQAILANPLNAKTLKAAINALEDLDEPTKNRLVDEVDDLNRIANMKREYNKKIREYLKDPTLINEAYQRMDDQIKQRDLDNKSADLALLIQNVNSMTELDRLIRENSAISPRVTKTALQKARQEGNDNVKNLIDDYERGRKFFVEFQEQSSRLSPKLNMELSEAAVTSWQEALADNLNVYDKFIEHMNESADLLQEAGNKEAADALRKVMKDLNDAKKSSSTNKNVAKPSEKVSEKPKKKRDIEEDEEGERKTPDDLEAKANQAGGLRAMMGGKKGKNGKKQEPPTTPKVLTLEDIKKDVMKEAKARGANISNISSLTKPLQQTIDEYNEDDSHEKITDITLRRWMQEDMDGEWESSAFERDFDDDEDFDDEEYKENRGEEMSQVTQGSFKSGYQSEFAFYDGGRNPLEYAVPYPGDDEQHKKVRQILKDFLAYQFVDDNWLGYAMQVYQDENMPVYFLKSTERSVNKPDRPVTFMAIELTPSVKRAIQKRAFNDKKGKTDISAGIHPVPINGKEYQIIGVLSINSEDSVSSEVAAAFQDLQMKLFEELHTKVAEERKKENPEPFVISEKHHSEITQVFTGRLEKYNDADDEGDKVSLFTFMTSPQNEDGGREDRRTSTEWKNGVPFHFGVVVNKGLKMQSVDGDTQVEEPNQEWRSKKGNNGAILLFIPKPDGRLYPVRCTRRAVDDWLESSDIDGSHKSGRDLLEDLLNPDSSVKNDYLERIIHLIDVLTSDDDKYSFSDRLDAKYRLASYFTFGRKNPIQIDVSTQEATITLEGGETIALNADNLHDNVMNFFEIISGSHRIKFTLPAPSGDNASGSNPDGKIDARSIIMSGVFEIGLRGFYNFNANVIVKPVDGSGNEIVAKTAPAEGGAFVPNEDRGIDRSYNINGEKKEYHITHEEGVTKVSYKDGSIPTDDEQNIVLALESIDDQNNESTRLDMITKVNKDRGVTMTKEQNKLIADTLADELNKYYTVYSSEGTLIYDAAGHELFSLDSKKGQELLGKVKEAVIKWVSSPEAWKALKEAAKAPKSETLGESVIIQDNSKGQAGFRNQPQGYIKNKHGIWVPVVLSMREGYVFEDGSTALGGEGKSASYYIEKGVVAIQDGTGDYIELIPDKIVGIFKLGKGDVGHVDITEDIQKEVATKQQPTEETATPLPVEEAEGNLRNVGKQMKDAMNTSGDIEEMDALIELGQVAIADAEAAGVSKSLIGNISGILKGLQTKANNHRRARGRAAGGSNEPQDSGLFSGVTLESLKSRKEEQGLIGVLARAYGDGTKPMMKAKATKIFNALQSTYANFPVTMSEEELKGKVEEILEMKKGWSEKLNQLVDELSKCK